MPRSRPRRRTRSNPERIRQSQMVAGPWSPEWTHRRSPPRLSSARGGPGHRSRRPVARDGHPRDADEVVRPALLWNDTRSASAARDLVDEPGGPAAWAHAVGSVTRSQFYRHQAALAGAARAAARRSGPGRALATRLAHRAHSRRRRGPTWRGGHGPRRRLGHRLLVAVDRSVPHRPVGARVRSAGRNAKSSRSERGCGRDGWGKARGCRDGRQHGCGTRARTGAAQARISFAKLVVKKGASTGEGLASGLWHAEECPTTADCCRRDRHGLFEQLPPVVGLIRHAVAQD